MGRLKLTTGKKRAARGVTTVDTLAAIDAYKAMKRRNPSLRCIAKMLGVSYAAAGYHVQRLVSSGKLDGRLWFDS